MNLVEFLRCKSRPDNKDIDDVKLQMEAIFPPSRWWLDINIEEYSASNYANLWSNELRKAVRKVLEEAGKDQRDYEAWLGAVHFISVSIAPRQLFERPQRNKGWRVAMLGIPAVNVALAGIASHYQLGMQHSGLGKASSFLHDVAADGLREDSLALPGRKANSDDWDKTGLISVDITEVAGTPLPNDGERGKVHLKDVRTTTLKKILSSYITLQVLPDGASNADFLGTLKSLEVVATKLASDIFPFNNLQSFEAIRSLAIQDPSSASARIRLKRKSRSQSVVRIYYGPPGTGKTITAVMEAVKLADPGFAELESASECFARFNELWGQVAFITFHQSLQYEDAIEAIRPVVSPGPVARAEEQDSEEDATEGDSSENGVPYRLYEGVLLRMIRSALEHPSKEFVLVIDEINRGDISRILGPLISALDPDKRIGSQFPVGIELQYPRLSEVETRLFLPPNIHFIGTMNSADRNIALVDYALRRRFDFVSVPPRPEALGMTSDDEPIDLRKLLSVINKRIGHLLGSEYMIGHGYFMSCKTNYDVVDVMARKVLPLLAEYFYGNSGLALLVLGDHPGNKFNIHVVEEDQAAFQSIFNVPLDAAARLGYRRHEANRNLEVDPRFWDANKIPASPGDSAYAFQAIRKIYDTARDPVPDEAQADQN